MTIHIATVFGLSALVLASAARAQPPGSASAVPGPAPTFADLDYASPEPATSNGHKLDLYIPSGAGRTMAGRHLDRRLGMVCGHRQAHGGWRGRTTVARWLRRRRRLDSFELTGTFSWSVARHKGSDPMAARECSEVRPRRKSDRDHGRQFRRLDNGNGRGDWRRP